MDHDPLEERLLVSFLSVALAELDENENKKRRKTSIRQGSKNGVTTRQPERQLTGVD